jgi:hypothetical protein
MNQNQADSGIPSDSIGRENALIISLHGARLSPKAVPVGTRPDGGLNVQNLASNQRRWPNTEVARAKSMVKMFRFQQLSNVYVKRPFAFPEPHHLHDTKPVEALT